MSVATSPTPTLAARALPRRLPAVYLELSKARLSAMVVLTAATGYAVAPAGAVDWARLVWTALGTGLAAACAAALNQVLEIGPDALMPRTRRRPLPGGDIGATHAFLFALACGSASMVILTLLAHPLAAALASLNIAIYVLLYTPLKKRTTLNTLVGAVCGAIPPMIGWAAARGALEPGAWILGMLLFVWQIPHFFALAWIYRHEYARGGFVMLPCRDRDGELTGRTMVLASLLLPLLGPTLMTSGTGGWMVAAGGVILGGWMVARSAAFHRRRSDATARTAFRASLIYLPLMMALLLIDRGPLAALGG
jgi:protoheme IX farnesyltransferase